MILKNLTHFLTITSLLLMATGCISEEEKIISSGLTRVHLFLSQETTFPPAPLIQNETQIINEHHRFLKPLVNLPKFQGQLTNSPDSANVFLTQNQSIFNSYFSIIDSSLKKELGNIQTLSKNFYEEKSIEESNYRLAFLYFKLQYLKNDLKTILSVLSPLTLVTGIKLEDPKLVEIQTNLQKNVFSLIGTSIIVSNDLKKVRHLIKANIKNKTMTDDLEKVLITTDIKLQKSLLKMKQNLTINDKHIFNQEKAKLDQMTFLYSPGFKYKTITKIISVAGNLTWGLVNTLIGASVIVVTMIASLATGTMLIDFPSFGFADNGMMIYADVTGISPFCGKMSLGLFELSNCAFKHFASGHEGGHALQSAVLGPLYLPTVIFSYLISGFDQGFMEALAWDADSLSDDDVI